MENYYAQPEKYNQTLWSYLKLIRKDGKHPRKPDGLFDPEENLEILRWVMRAIMNKAPNGIVIKFVLQYRINKADFSIQSWSDITDHANGFTSIVRTEKTELQAVYNVCVEYVLNQKS